MKLIKNKGFTLIELLVTIAVLSILVLLAMPRFLGYTQKAELARIQHDVKVMEQEVGTMLINKDDDFNNWEDNSKDLNQLIQENKLFEKEGKVEDLSIDKTYKVIPEKYKGKINTKLKGTFYANSGGKVYYEHGKPLFRIPAEPGEKEPGVQVDPEKPAEPEEESEHSDEEIKDSLPEGYIPIATANELNNVRNTTIETYGKGTKWEGKYEGGLDKKYIQVADIVLSNIENWTPIGTKPSASSASFKGKYDGNGFNITELTINRSIENYVGLFGYTQGATIENVTLEDINVTGGTFVGGLVGYAYNGTTIENSYSTGSVAGASTVGGLTGLAYGSTIENSYSTVLIAKGSNAGGLVGKADGSTNITKSYFTGSVTGFQYLGGLVGLAENNTTISNSYTTGSVTGTYEVGGFVGKAKDSNITNSYATGTVKGSANVGGLVGVTESSNNISNSYWNIDTTGRDTSSGGGTGKTTEDMKQSDTYLGWDFENIWKIDEGEYLTLR